MGRKEQAPASLIVEIRSGAGGADAKLLVEGQLILYGRYAARRRLDLLLVEQRPGFVVLRLRGPPAALRRFELNEGGGYRVQRVPPTERRGRVHTSTITVAVLPEPRPVDVRVIPSELDWKSCRGSGSGGQHKNVTDSAVQLTHRPSGIQVRSEGERSLTRNKVTALAVLRARLLAGATDRATEKRDARRRRQTLQSDRAEKRRTVRYQADQVVDHETGKRMSAKRYSKGYIEEVWS